MARTEGCSGASGAALALAVSAGSLCVLPHCNSTNETMNAATVRLTGMGFMLATSQKVHDSHSPRNAKKNNKNRYTHTHSRCWFRIRIRIAPARDATFSVVVSPWKASTSNCLPPVTAFSPYKVPVPTHREQRRVQGRDERVLNGGEAK